MKKTTALALALIAGGLIAGCGGSSGPSGPLGDYQTQLQAALLPLGNALRSIGVGSAASGPQQAKLLADAQKSMDQARSDVDALDAPSEVKSANDELVQAVDQFAKSVDQAKPADMQSLVSEAKDFATNLANIEKDLSDAGVSAT
jgi:hypothetical protein